jgi:hypothetical protein
MRQRSLNVADSAYEPDRFWYCTEQTASADQGQRE